MMETWPAKFADRSFLNVDADIEWIKFINKAVTYFNIFYSFIFIHKTIQLGETFTSMNIAEKQ